MRFDGKSIVVLGGTAGIGRATALAFAAEGAQVGITGRNQQALAEMDAHAAISAIAADMGDVDACRAALNDLAAQIGGIDVLFVNAGVGGFAPIADVTAEFWDGIHDVNLRGAFFAIQSALPLMRDGGCIVITGSIGSMMALPGNVAYAAAKAGLRAMARIIGKELLVRNIRVNMVSPGPIDTEIFKRGATPAEIAESRSAMASAVPMGRMGSSEEVAQAVVFLASDAASFINGVDLCVDGGCANL